MHAKNPIFFCVYSLGCWAEERSGGLEKFAKDSHVKPTPDIDYKFVARAPEEFLKNRPVIIGAGPCGLLCALVLAQMGFKPIILERGKVMREHTKKREYWGFWRKSILRAGIERAIWRGRRGNIFWWKTLQPDKKPKHLGRKVLINAEAEAREFVARSAPPYRHFSLGEDGG